MAEVVEESTAQLVAVRAMDTESLRALWREWYGSKPVSMAEVRDFKGRVMRQLVARHALKQVMGARHASRIPYVRLED